MVEHTLGKGEVASSILALGSTSSLPNISFYGGQQADIVPSTGGVLRSIYKEAQIGIEIVSLIDSESQVFATGSEDKRDRAIALGMFDGLHLGHQSLVKEVVDYSDKNNLIPSAMTFRVPPIHWLSPETEIELLTSLDERLELFKSFGIEQVIIFDFPEISKLEAKDYFNNVLNDLLRAKFLVSGNNHFFGKNKQGNIDLLSIWAIQNGIKYKLIEPIEDANGNLISSSLIRKFLKEAKIREANQISGHNFLIVGELMNGKKLGRKLGFPTLNVKYPKDKVSLKFGVYGALTEIDGELLLSAANYGIRPTVGVIPEPLLESHLLFLDDEYINKLEKLKEGDKLKVYLIDFIRAERKFNSIEELKAEIQQDCKQIRNVFSGLHGV